MKQYWSNALNERRKRSRLATEAGLALGLGAGLLIALSPGTAFAVFKEVASSSDMNFGEAAGDGSLSGMVILDTSDGRTFVGGAYDMAPGSALSGSFKLVFTGQPTGYTCTLPTSITLTGPGPALTVDSFTTSPALSGTGSGDLIITVGASLQLASGQTAGDYLGNLIMDCAGPPPGKDSASIKVLVKLFEPISISVTGDLAFGDAVPTGVAGTVTVDTIGGRSAVDVDLMGGTVSAAGFTVGGECGTAYAITLPGTGVIDAGGPTMTVDTFTDDSLGQPLCNPGDSFNVGATLHVGAGQVPGNYSGTFSVTAEYN